MPSVEKSAQLFFKSGYRAAVKDGRYIITARGRDTGHRCKYTPTRRDLEVAQSALGSGIIISASINPAEVVKELAVLSRQQEQAQR